MKRVQNILSLSLPTQISTTLEKNIYTAVGSNTYLNNTLIEKKYDQINKKTSTPNYKFKPRCKEKHSPDVAQIDVLHTLHIPLQTTCHHPAGNRSQLTQFCHATDKLCDP